VTRVTLITEVATPFRTPLFGALADKVELTVLFLGASDPRRAYRIEDEEMRFVHHVLPGRELRRGGAWLVVSRGVEAALDKAQPDVVVLGGWNQPAFWRALRWARRRSIPAVVWVESTGSDARGGNALSRRLKLAFLRRCAACIVPGSASAAYLLALGVPAERIATAPNAVDLSRFRDRVAELRRDREENPRPLVLTAARLSPEKGLDVLLRAADGLDADVAIAGEGPAGEELRRAAPANVRFLGHLSQDELATWYARADAFVLPSRSEPWGMVLNEAAAAGLPLVATTAVGAADDLVEEGANGFRVSPGDVAALRAALERVATDAGWREAAGRRSSLLAERFTPAAWADAVALLAERVATT
jgi:glycosyltransferase involved in cell wall biosynthesis